MSGTLVKVRKRIPFDYDFKKREKWLNEMAAVGMNARPRWRFGSFIEWFFEPGEPGEYAYRIELLPSDAKKAATREYLAFVEDMGIEVVLAQGRLAVFRKRSADGVFELFSDVESQIQYLRRQRRWMWGVLVFGVAISTSWLLQLAALLSGPIPAPLFVAQLVVLAAWATVLVSLAVNALRIGNRIRELDSEQAISA
jgi:hypothetical protein